MKQWFSILSLTLLLCLCVPPQSAQAQSGNQWRVDYFSNLDWAGAPVYTEYTALADYNWGQGSPGPNMPNQNYTARLSTDAYFYAGLYRFTFLADDELRLSINNVVYFDTIGRSQSGKSFTVDIPMNEGMSRVNIDYRQYGGPGYLHVYWGYVKSNPSNPVYVPPQQSTQPPVQSATSLATQYGDYTLCIRQGLHQSNCFQANGQWNSPNLGSIQMEPQIVIWQQCQADTERTQRLYADRDPQGSKCSKTEAGWFPE